MKRVVEFCEHHKKYSTVLVRLGIAAVFLWFGIDKFIHPINWIGWVPDWMKALIPVSMLTFMYFHGAVETLVGVLLVVGYKVRFAALVASITIVGVLLAMIGTGQAEMMLRDAGLLAASLSLFLTGCDCVSVDGFRK